MDQASSFDGSTDSDRKAKTEAKRLRKNAAAKHAYATNAALRARARTRTKERRKTHKDTRDRSAYNKKKWDEMTTEQKADRNAAKAASYAADPDKFKTRVKAWQDKTGYTKRYYAENSDAIATRNHAWRLRPGNKIKMLQSKQEWRAENKNKTTGYLRKHNLKKYGYHSVEAFYSAATAQQVCPGCLEQFDFSRSLAPRHPVPDHCHETEKLLGIMKIRGIICRRCNTTLGMAGDSAETLRRLAGYLEVANTTAPALELKES